MQDGEQDLLWTPGQPQTPQNTHLKPTRAALPSGCPPQLQDLQIPGITAAPTGGQLQLQRDPP